MSTILWITKLGGPRIERLDQIARYEADPRPLTFRPKISPGFSVFLFAFDIFISVLDWWEDRKNTIYLEKK